MRDSANQRYNSRKPDVRFRDCALAFEFLCWVIVALAPFLRWINGPAVTDDQFAIQVAIVIIAAVSALTLRVYNWLQKDWRK